MLDKTKKPINENIERLLLKCLSYYLIVVFIITVAGAYSGYLENNIWKIGDWLINYQGGMVRRGLLGELIYKLSQLIYLDLGFIVFLIQVLFYAIYFFFSYVLLKKQYSLLPYTLLIFSPYIYTFQINDLQGGYRKEIIYLGVLAFLVFSSKMINHRTFEKVFFATLLLFPTLILTHEMLVLFLPYLLVVYISVTDLTLLKKLAVIFLVLTSLLSFFATIYYSGTAINVTAIYDSIASQGYILNGGAIAWLDKSPSYAMEKVIKYVYEKHYIPYYLLTLLLSIIAYIPIRKNLKVVFKKKISKFLIFISILSSLGLFLVAIDWGRIIYIHLVSFFLLSLITTVPLSSNGVFFYQKKNKGRLGIKIKFLIVAFVVIYSLSWHIPLCDHANPFYGSNAEALIKPHKKIIRAAIRYNKLN